MTAQTMSLWYELACKGFSAEKAHYLVTLQNDLCCFIGLTLTLSLKLSFFNYLCCFCRKCHHAIVHLVPHLIAAAILNFRKMLIWALKTLIWPVSIYVLNFRQISSMITMICCKNTNRRLGQTPSWTLPKVGLSRSSALPTLRTQSGTLDDHGIVGHV